MKAINRGLMATVLGIAALTAACSDDDNNGGGGSGTTTSWIGIFQADNATNFGSETITANTATPAPPMANGRLEPSASAPIAATVDYNQTQPVVSALTLTGTYDPATDALAVTDQGYTFTGGFDGTSRLEGPWTGPGPIQGVFVSLMDDGSGQAFCGTYTGATASGVVAFVVVNGILAGNAYQSGSTVADAVDGTVAGTTIAFTSGTATGVGTITGTSAAGTVDAGGGVTFTWTATECTP
jgi:hypothetical protein